jgi:AraC-like DNA-binding protein
MFNSPKQSGFPGAEPAVSPRLHFRSHNLDQAHSFLNGKDLSFAVSKRDARALDVQINGFYLPGGMYLGLTEYGARAVVKPTPRRLDYWLWLPVSGRMQTTFGKRHHVSDVHRGAILSFPCMVPSWNFVDEHASRITVVLCREHLERQLALLLGKPCDATFDPPLEFAPVLDLTSGHGRSIARLARMGFADFEQAGPITRNPLTVASLEDFIVNELLLSHPHNYSDALYGPTLSIAPRDVKRAIDFIEANLPSPISLADVIGSAGVPGRTLFKHFADYKGMSPMQYLRTARLEKVREELLRGYADGTVADVAMAWGFSHLGRFSVEYRRRYGERPSQSLRRSHQR